MHLTEESQTALMAAFETITDEEIVRLKGLCTIGPIDIVVFDGTVNTHHPKHYLVSIPAGTTVQFWRASDVSTVYSRDRCTLSDPNSKFKLLYNVKRARQPFLLMWLGDDKPMSRIELAGAG